MSGRRPLGERVPFRPIHDVNELYESLDDRVMAGFGGVAEYGITVRWNKNFLKIIRLLLERRAQFSMFGGVRFGGTHDRRQRVRAGVRSRRAVRGRGTSHRDPHEERPGARRAPGVGLPDGAAVDRRRQDELGRESATAHADRGDRRRTDGHRHGHRIARVLRRAGGEISGALRDAGRRAKRNRPEPMFAPIGARRNPPPRTNFSRTPAPFAPNAPAAARRAASRILSNCSIPGAA